MANLIETARKIEIKGKPAVKGITKPRGAEPIRIPEALGILLVSAGVSIVVEGVKRFSRDMTNLHKEVAGADL